MARETKTKTKKGTPEAIERPAGKKREIGRRAPIAVVEGTTEQKSKGTIKKESKKAELKKAGEEVETRNKKEIRRDSKKASRVEIGKGTVASKKNKGIASRTKGLRNKKNLMQGENEEIKNEEEMKEKIEHEEEEITNGEEKSFIKWKGKSFLRREGEKFFYQVSLVASIMVFLWSVADGSRLSAITFFMLAVIIILELKDVPRDVDYEINIDGILIDGKLYRFDEIQSFEIAKKGEFDIVKLQLRSTLFPTREIHLAEGQDLVYIETLLEYFLPKEAREDTLLNLRKRERSKEDLTEDEFIDQKVDEYLNGKR
ncbi:MAG: hypothetical protein WCQ96_02290 [Patescibacteria group bacterium]